jgi:hypothetical protein
MGAARQKWTMSTAKQIEANRLNSKKSSGPKGSIGKETSSKNAIKHGLLSSEILLPWENNTDLEVLRSGLVRQLLPQGEVEQILVERVVSLTWRLRRAGNIETAIFALNRYLDEYNNAKKYSDTLTRVRQAVESMEARGERMGQNLITENELAADLMVLDKAELLSSDLANLGKNFVSGVDALTSLHRYEGGLERSFFKTLHELQRLQATRLGHSVPIPVAIDVHGDRG